jgi:hypothetical protein
MAGGHKTQRLGGEIGYIQLRTSRSSAFHFAGRSFQHRHAVRGHLIQRVFL